MRYVALESTNCVDNSVPSVSFYALAKRIQRIEFGSLSPERCAEYGGIHPIDKLFVLMYRHIRHQYITD